MTFLEIALEFERMDYPASSVRALGMAAMEVLEGYRDSQGFFSREDALDDAELMYEMGSVRHSAHGFEFNGDTVMDALFVYRKFNE